MKATQSLQKNTKVQQTNTKEQENKVCEHTPKERNNKVNAGDKTTKGQEGIQQLKGRGKNERERRSNE